MRTFLPSNTTGHADHPAVLRVEGDVGGAIARTQTVTDIVPTGGTKPRPVVQTGSYGAALSHLVVQYDDTTGEATVTSSLVPLYQSATPDPTVAGIVRDAWDVARTSR